jgi:hypothetical protein
MMQNIIVSGLTIKLHKEQSLGFLKHLDRKLTRNGREAVEKFIKALSTFQIIE